MEHFTFPITRTAHYYTLGKASPEVRQLWVVCHGYAQLADEFLENFRLLDNEHTLVVAPEGLNYFYRKGFSGPVGANWMTRHFREEAIEDYTDYLQSLLAHLRDDLPNDVRIILLGFSQGTATVCRWIMRHRPEFHDLLLWAGLPPEDIDYTAADNYLKTKNLYLLYGSHDPFLTPDRLSSVEDIEQKNGIDFEEQEFDGGHEIPSDVLQKMLEQLK
jgi:predicted esterase